MNIYQQNILEHFKHPKNFGELKHANAQAHMKNPLCGDEITIMLDIEDNKLKDIRFEGTGCAISQATASILTEEIKGMDIEEIKHLSTEDILEMIGIELSPTRMKCALLSKDAVIKAIEDYTEGV